MAIHSTNDSGGPPSGWKIQLFANISGSEPFVVQVAIQMTELVDASMIPEAKRDELREAILAITFDGLMPAFEHLKQIRASARENVPELNRRQNYEDFTISLWRAYKDLMPRAVKLMGFDIGFLFQNDTIFEKGLTAFVSARPKDLTPFRPYLRAQRDKWQNELARFRNFLEHKSDANPSAFKSRYEPSHAEELFDAAWQAIAEVLAALISMHFPPGVTLVEIPPEQRNAALPRRFGFAMEGIPPSGV